MLKVNCIFIALLGIIFFQSCSSVRSVALNTSVDLFEKGSLQMETESEWDFFEAGALANIKMLEGLLYNDPENEKLLTLVIKGYSGLGFGVYETLYITDKYKDRANSQAKANAISAYTRAVEYGRVYMGEKGIDSSFLLENVLTPRKIVEKLKSELDEDDVEAIFYTAQSWMSLINLQRTDLSLVAQLPAVKSLFDWSCELKPDIQNGACSLFYGLYELSRPKMLGGNPKKGREILSDYMNKNPYNMLAKITYFEYVLIAGGEEEKYKSFKNHLRSDFNTFEFLNNLGKLKSDNPFLKKPTLNLLNAISLKRYKLLLENEKEFF